MNMTDPAVELYYGAERADVREVLRWRILGMPGGRRQLLVWLVLLPLVAPLLIVVQHGRRADPGGLAVAAGVGALCGAGGLLLDRWRVARRMYAWASEYPEYRCVVTGLGVQNHRPDGTAVAYRWAQYTGWTETRNLFVFVFHNGDLGWLPKRAAQGPSGIDRVRGILEGNLRRL